MEACPGWIRQTESEAGETLLPLSALPPPPPQVLDSDPETLAAPSPEACVSSAHQIIPSQLLAHTASQHYSIPIEHFTCASHCCVARTESKARYASAPTEFSVR